MNTLIHADIFFFVTTIALILITIPFVIALVYLIKILRDVSEISRKVKEESIEIIEDVKYLRSELEDGGFKITRFITFFAKMFMKKRRASRRNSEE